MQTHQHHAAAQAAYAQQQEEQRKHLIQLCNIARSDRKWIDDEWTKIKRDYGGADSLTEMEIDDLERIMAHARRCGFRIKHKRADGRKSRPLSIDAQRSMIRGMWLEMAQLGIVRHADESALGSWLSNSQSANVVTDLALMDAQQITAAINRLREFRVRELMAGEMFCPKCGYTFTPTRKQALAFPNLACDRHTPQASYQWRMTRSGGREPKAHVKTSRG
jgi:phage gp16-like protein